MNRMDLVRDLAEWSGHTLELGDFPTWRTVFRLFVELARDAPLVVVLDEFQYLLGGEDDAASQLVAVWDREVADLPLTVVLCGSEVSTMVQLREADQPLYGRFDWSHRLRPFDFFDASRMLPGRTPRETAAAYGIFGGTPQHLAAVAPQESLSEAVCRTMLEPAGTVRVQLENIVEQEKGIRKPAEYRAVLAGVARGRTERNEIATGTGLEHRPETVRRILDRLQEMELIWSERNFGAPSNAPRRYRISDNAVRFWYHFVDPARSQLELGEPREWGLPGAARWARWEGRDRTRRPVEIDVVAELSDGSMLTGEVKWSSRPTDRSLHTDLLRDLEALAASGYAWAHAALPESDDARFVYFSAGGFTDGFRALASEDERIRLLELKDLYAGRGDS